MLPILFSQSNFTPNSLYGGGVWLDATQTALGAVPSWTDLFGNGNNAAQATGANQPICMANRINGLRALNFQNQSLMIPDNLALRPGNAGITIFIVAKNNTDTGTDINIIRKWGSSGNLGWLIDYNNAGAPDTVAFGISNDGTANAFVTPTQPAIGTSMLLEYRGRAGASTNSQFYLNGISAGTSALNVFASTANILISENTAGINFDIGEILIYMRELSIIERVTVKNYLSNKWGISIIPPGNFISSWKTNNAGTSTSTQITIPTVASGIYNCTVDWGDGTNSTITAFNDPAWTHTYSIAGTYTVIIVGTFTGIEFNNGGDKAKLLQISNWGEMQLGNTGNYFFGCSNLIITATDILDMTGTTTLAAAFRLCTSIVTIPTINSFNTSAVTTTGGMFIGCAVFNQALTFDTSAVTAMNSMFSGCIALNQPLTFNTSAVNTMFSMFNGCTTFNQALTFNTSAVTTMSSMFNGCAAFNKTLTFNTSAVTTTALMFNACVAFNQPLTFNTSAITTMNNMFNGCTIFNQDISAWSIASLINASVMFTSSGFTITNYNKLLDSVSGWPSQAIIQNNVTFGAGTAHYSGANAIAGRAILVTGHTWTITDGGTP